MKQNKTLGLTILAAILASFVSLSAVHFMSFLNHFEELTVDFRIAGFGIPKEQDKSVVIVAINEETLENFSYRSPVDRKFLSDLLLDLEAKGARHVYLDLLFDQPTESDKDLELFNTLKSLSIPLRVAYSNEKHVVTERQEVFQDEFVPQKLRSDVRLAADPIDGTVRWLLAGGKDVLPVPYAIAHDLGLTRQLPLSNESQRIDWRIDKSQDEKSFAIYPAHLVKILPEAWVRDKVVLVGLVVSLTDRHKTPFSMLHQLGSSQMPGVEVFAHQVSQVIDDRSISELGISQKLGVTLVLAALGAALGGLGLNLVLLSIGLVAVSVSYFVGVIWGYSSGLPILPAIAPVLAFVLSVFLSILILGREERERRKFVQSAFSRYVEPAVVDQLINKPELLNLQGEKRQLSFIFTDIAGFTTLSEKMPAEELTRLLNEYLEGMCAVIHRHGGIVDKFIGDAVMCFFNAPLAQPDHADRAFQCALELDAFAESFRETANENGIALGVTRIGVHSGEAVVGNIGSATRLDFTALGDTVNAASRVEGVNKYFGTRVCVTEGIVLALTRKNHRFRPIGRIVLKGKNEPLGLFQPMSVGSDDSLYASYMSAYEALESMPSQALLKFQDLIREFPEDALATFHHQRLAEGQLGSLIHMGDK